jgi:hypothetical protein
MSFNRYSTRIAGAALGVVLGSASVLAQESCGSLYNQVMRVYQTQGPQSQQYAALSNYYGERCLSGSSAAPSYPYAYQSPYAYQQPVDPGAAFLGGIVGGVVGEALEGDRSRRYDEGRGRRGW